MANALAQEKSLYLRQHAHQPVAWEPWRPDILEKARQMGRPLFISIGYAACHWCHVMARESFEDEEIATLLNENFLPVKVDREEHPEIDAIYLLACEVARGQAGWPLTVLALPDGWPFWVATYLPKESDGLRAGLKEVLLTARKLWETERSSLFEAASRFKRALKNISFLNPAYFESQEVLTQALGELETSYDKEYGGFGPGPKFPLSMRLLFLLRFGARFQNEKALHMVRKTLLRMRFSALFDQVGSGFHRYAIDRAWKVPHFEKMLYDQGLLLYVYAEAAQILDDPLFAQVALEIVSYLEEHLRAPQGGFYSSESAENEGEEGKFYTWTLEELKAFLSPEEFDFIEEYFGLKEEGNYLEEGSGHPTGRNILHPSCFPWEMEKKGPGFERRLAEILKKLKERRLKRPSPPRDEKILTDWNGLTIAALARAGKILGENHFLSLAEESFSFLVDHCRAEKRLLHIFEGQVKGLLEDYVYLAWGTWELFKATGKARYRAFFHELLSEIDRLFKDEDKLYRQVGKDEGGAFLLPYYPVYEGALPAANGLLALLFREAGAEEKAYKMLYQVGGHLKEHPSSFPSFLLALLPPP